MNKSDQMNQSKQPGALQATAKSVQYTHASIGRSLRFVDLVCLVYLVCFVYLVEPDQPDKPNRPNKPEVLGLACWLCLFSLEFGPAVIEPLRG